MAKTNVIDPEGDVILICGKTEFQVSSKVLSLASPVFKALFSPSFAEGQPTSSKASRIQLHDDDAESMLFMCAVLHHKCAFSKGIGLERLERLAVVTDKYDVSYAFDEAQFFNSLTKFMMLNLPNDGKAQTASRKYGIPEEIESHIPEGLIEAIFLAEQDVKREMQIQIEQLISPIAEKSTAGDLILGSDDIIFSHCDCISISSLINGLSRQGLWPLTSAVHRLSISMLCKKLEACDVGLASRITKLKKCSRCPENVAAKVAKIREAALTRFEGLCLDCIKNPGKSPEQRLQCRVPHQHFRGLPRQLPVSEGQ
ncbi:hypothetical protein HO133_009713 [Letharia lupina]|uniref:BTB domain-containing protein n=1 Tax=Letharia lupina TaxID=560253 RepID=A0A8H6FEN4_9LECA|nr:uncharacterized protein HO133_009713 [Letharia lupina]KAF6225712.1 hypothetical protein HO133_009713 [Letharia lupina]